MLAIKRKYGSRFKTKSQIKVQLCSKHRLKIYHQVCGQKKTNGCLTSSINTVHIIALRNYLAFKFYKTTSLIFSFKLLYRSR